MNEVVEKLKELNPQIVESSKVEIEEVTIKFTFEKENGEIKDPLKREIYAILQDQQEETVVEDVTSDISYEESDFSQE